VAGIDATNSANIEFTIYDGVKEYSRNLGHSNVFRVVKLFDEASSNVSRFWAVYDRSKEPLLGNYPNDAQILISVYAKDRTGLEAKTQNFNFKTESQTEREIAEDPAYLPATEAVGGVYPAMGEAYDAGLQVVRGELKGAKIIYSSSEPVKPVFGPVDELPPLNAVEASGVGTAMNLKPPTVFNTPVRIFIPCPGYADVAELVVFLFNGRGWVPACDTDGGVLAGGDGWMVPGSRANHNDGDPSTIEIKIHHFTGVQAGTVISDSQSNGGAAGVSGGGGSCFISTIDGKSEE
jgi:hypothetical protein